MGWGRGAKYESKYLMGGCSALLGVICADGLGVQIGSEKGNASSDLGLHGQGGAEKDDAGHNDGHALDDVADTVADGSHTAQGVEGELVVKMVQETNCDKLGPEGSGADLQKIGKASQCVEDQIDASQNSWLATPNLHPITARTREAVGAWPRAINL